MKLKGIENERAEIRAGDAIIGIIVLIVLAAIVAWATFTVVPKGEVGLVDTFGNVDDNSLAPGSYLFAPWRHIEKINVQTQQYEYKDIDNTLTKEGLKVKIDASILYHIKPDYAVSLYKTVRGDPFDTLITPNFMGVTRDEVKRWSAEDIYTGKSTDIQMDVQRRLGETLEPKGIVIEAVLFRGLVLPPQVTDAIEKKISEKQAVEQMAFTVEKEKKEAERKIVEANGTATANLIIARSITPELIQWNYVLALKENKNTMYVLGTSGSNGPSVILPSAAKNQ